MIEWFGHRILEEAVKAFEERLDDVKEMNKICTYSRCVTVRDGQKNDKVRERACIELRNKM